MSQQTDHIVDTNKMITAVEWLIDRLLDGSIRFEETQMGFLIAMKNGDEIEQAKAMEKEQIMNAYNKGNMESEIANLYAEKFYKETYNK
jgi:hypothetical protein